MERLVNYILDIYPIEGVPLKRRVILHGVFWGIMYVVFWFFISFPSDTLLFRFLSATSTTLTCIVFFYITLYIIPFVYKKYSLSVGIFFISLILIAFDIFLATEQYIRLWIIFENNVITAQNKRMYNTLYSTYKAGFWNYFSFLKIVTDIFQLTVLSLSAFFLKFTRTFAITLSEKKQLEIDFLRLQINPHFLVNTLNNIFGLVVVQDERSSGAILSLSNLLNYVLYESSFPVVTVEKEIEFLRNFVALELIRNSSKVQVQMNVEGELKGEIAPLILIAFIENAFKHGVGDSTTHNYVHINIKVEKNTLSLNVLNGKVNKVSEKQKKSLGGIGLVNVQRRLDSLYPNRHSLQVIPESDKYQIVFKISLI
jgi:two-component system, LytTR family, sensor kinase